MIYVDPLGKITEINYANNHINKLKTNNMLYEERLNSAQKNAYSNNIFFAILLSIQISKPKYFS